jgi:hypothetical protein
MALNSCIGFYLCFILYLIDIGYSCLPTQAIANLYQIFLCFYRHILNDVIEHKVVGFMIPVALEGLKSAVWRSILAQVDGNDI